MTTARIFGLLWVAFILGVAPIQALAARKKIRQRRPTRLQVYASGAASMSVVTIITFLLDRSGDRVGLRAFLFLRPAPPLAGWTAATLAACVAVWAAFLWERKLNGRAADPVMVELLPRTASEKALFVPISLMAGVLEEYVMRGFALGLLASATASMWLAFLLVTIGFALAHGYQGLGGPFRSGLLGAILAAPVITTGSLFPSIIAHATVDMLSGFFSLALLRRWGLVRAETAGS